MITFIKNITIALAGIIVSLIIVVAMSYIEEKNNRNLAVVEIGEEETGDGIEIEEIIEGIEIVKESEKDSPTPEEPKVLIEAEEDEIIKMSLPNLDSEILDLIVIPPIENKITLSINEVNSRTRNALVNIICMSQQGGLFQPITGSGIIIDNRGVIITNAHIAQYYLLKDYIVPNFLDCIIRTGSPAVNTYKAELLYISSSWIVDNFQKIAESSPKGTGKDDFALLLITETTKPNTTLPAEFPFIPPDIRGEEPKVGDFVVAAGYPAGFLGGTSIQKDLHAVSTVTQIEKVFTFKENTLDLFSVGGSIAAQKGSSGGGVVSLTGKLLGIVVTASEEVQTDDRDLRAISSFHINESMKNDTGGVDLNNYLLGDLFAKSLQFKNIIAPGLTALLESAFLN